MAEHPKIWLMPDCPCNDYDGGRMWCQDDNGPCEECGRQWVCYVLAPQLAVGDSSAAVNPSDAAIMAMYEPETLAETARDSSASGETKQSSSDVEGYGLEAWIDAMAQPVTSEGEIK